MTLKLALYSSGKKEQINTKILTDSLLTDYLLRTKVINNTDRSSLTETGLIGLFHVKSTKCKKNSLEKN